MAGTVRRIGRCDPALERRVISNLGVTESAERLLTVDTTIKGLTVDTVAIAPEIIERYFLDGRGRRYDWEGRLVPDP